LKIHTVVEKNLLFLRIFGENVCLSRRSWNRRFWIWFGQWNLLLSLPLWRSVWNHQSNVTSLDPTQIPRLLKGLLWFKQEQLENGEEEATCPSCSLIVKVVYNKVCIRAGGSNWLSACIALHNMYNMQYSGLCGKFKIYLYSWMTF
jgi:hypothetical protein